VHVARSLRLLRYTFLDSFSFSAEKTSAGQTATVFLFTQCVLVLIQTTCRGEQSRRQVRAWKVPLTSGSTRCGSRHLVGHKRRHTARLAEGRGHGFAPCARQESEPGCRKALARAAAVGSRYNSHQRCVICSTSSRTCRQTSGRGGPPLAATTRE